MNKTIQLTNEQLEALQRGESITIEPPKKKWEPEGGGLFVEHSGNIREGSIEDTRIFGMSYPSREIAERAAEMMRHIHRYIAYALEYWPEYEAPGPGSRTYFVSFDSALGIWVPANNLNWRLPWIPYGPEYKVLELVDKLNSGEVKF